MTKPKFKRGKEDKVNNLVHAISFECQGTI